jgi:hypothetical protein
MSANLPTRRPNGLPAEQLACGLSNREKAVAILRHAEIDSQIM